MKKLSTAEWIIIIILALITLVPYIIVIIALFCIMGIGGLFIWGISECAVVPMLLF